MTNEELAEQIADEHKTRIPKVWLKPLLLAALNTATQQQEAELEKLSTVAGELANMVIESRQNVGKPMIAQAASVLRFCANARKGESK